MDYPSPAGLVVGLGNPGRKYSQSRHNIGFAVLDALIHPQEPSSGQVCPIPNTGKGKYELFKWDLPEEEKSWLLCRPLTYMNLSGVAVRALCATFRFKPAQMLVVHDELDLPLGRLRFKFGGGLAGHRGLRSIVTEIGSREFYRLRIGIGRPEPGVEVVEHVLSPFQKAEMAELTDILALAVDGIQIFRRQGFDQAVNRLQVAQRS